MNEYTIHIESAEGLATEEGLSAMHDALNNDAEALGASVGIDLTRDVYAATFQVNAPTLGAAAWLGTTAFGKALEAAGHATSDVGKLEVIPEAVSTAA